MRLAHSAHHLQHVSSLRHWCANVMLQCKNTILTSHTHTLNIPHPTYFMLPDNSRTCGYCLYYEHICQHDTHRPYSFLLWQCGDTHRKPCFYIIIWKWPAEGAINMIRMFCANIDQVYIYRNNVRRICFNLWFVYSSVGQANWSV